MQGDFISICHQGYSNTETLGQCLLAGYPLAKKMGFDYGECDVKLTSDNQVVCCHDASFVDQSTQQTIVIAEHTLAELQTYNYYGGTIATLDEIMQSCKINGLGLVIEHTYSTILNYVFPIVKKYGMQDRVIYLVGYVDDNPNYSLNLYEQILNFYSKSTIMIFANATTINAVTSLLNNITINNNRLYVLLPYSDFTVAQIIGINNNLKADISTAIWTVDNLTTCKQYLPYVTAIISNKISSADIF